MHKNASNVTEGHRLLRARVEKYDQMTVAKELGLKQGTISRIYHARVRPRGDFIGRCYAAYGWNPLVWLTEDELHNTHIRRVQSARKKNGRSAAARSS